MVVPGRVGHLNHKKKYFLDTIFLNFPKNFFFKLHLELRFTHIGYICFILELQSNFFNFPI